MTLQMRLVRVLFVTGLSVLSAVVVARVFDGGLATVVAMASALAGSGLAHVIAGRRLALSIVGHLVGSLLLLAVVGLMLGGNALGAVLDAGARLLSTGWPAPLTSDLAPIAVLPGWFAGAMGAEMLHRSQRRTAPLVGPLATAGLGLAATVPAGRLPLVFVAVFATLGLGVIGAGGGQRSADGLPRILATSVVVSILGALIAPMLVQRDAADPRSLRDNPVVEIAAVSPLAQLRAERSVEPVRPRFDVVALDGAPVGPYWRIAALTDFDGRSWVPSDRLLPTSSTVGTSDDVEASVADLAVRDFDLVANQLVAPWIPVTGRPVSISESVRTDADGGSLIADEPVGLGTAIRLQSRSPIDRNGLAEGAAASAGTSASSAIPGDVGDLAREVTSEASTTLEQLDALSAFFVDDFVLDEFAPPGQSVGRLRGFLFDDRAGSTEQFVAAFTLMARSLGLPARVAVGYRLPDAVAAADRAAVTSDMASAWPEVRFVGVGWVAFELSDLNVVAGGAPAVGVDGGGIASGAPVPGTVPTTLPPNASDTTADGGEASVVRQVLAAVGFVGLTVIALVVPSLVVPMLKRRRSTRRHRRGGAAERVAGAWLEAVDLVEDAGGSVSDSATNDDVVRVGAGTLGHGVGEPMGRLARRASTAAFAPGAPGEDVVEAAWSDLTEIRSRAAEDVGRAARFRRRQSLRSLRGRQKGRRWKRNAGSAAEERTTVDVA